MARFAESDISPRDGFIREIFMNVCNNCDDETMNSFSQANGDEAKIRFISSLDCRQAFKVERNTTTLKNADLAQTFKQKGNEKFQAKQWMTALDFYNKSLLVLPAENEQDIAIALANRSAALYHMEKYDLALQDIAIAERHYPADMKHKLKERSARCHLGKKDLTRALKSFQETVTHLDYSKLSLDKRGKLEKDAQIMVKMLTRQLETEKKLKIPPSLRSLSLGPCDVKNKMSKAIAFDRTEMEGRFAKADRLIKPGEQILSEKAHCTAIFEKFATGHCQNCFERTITPLPCPQCVDIVFCSEQCRDDALKSYHRYECGILQTIWKSGVSINASMALRMITQQPLEYFLNLRGELTDDLDYDNVKHLQPHDYRRVYGLVRHEDKRDAKSYFQYAFLATFLIDLLRAVDYFPRTGDDADNSMMFIGGLLYRNLQLLQFNSHEIFDLLKHKQDNLTQTVSIGAGLYPTLALFNHSCNPSIVRYFKGTSVCVHTIRTVNAGDTITENYGPLYSQNSKSERQRVLKKLYWFDCACEACNGNWPIYADMNTEVIRFKCTGTVGCKNVISIPIDCNEFMIQCIQCGEFTNVLKGLKACQDTEMLEKVGKRLFNEGKIDKALAKYLQMIGIFDEVMAPPFQDYCKCQQAIKDCLLEYGNRIIVD